MMPVEIFVAKSGKYRVQFVGDKGLILNTANFDSEREAQEALVGLMREFSTSVEFASEGDEALPAWPWDLRQTGVFLALDRVHGNFMDRKAYSYLQKLVVACEDTGPEAIAELETSPGLCDLAIAEVQRLGCHVAIVTNRSLNPRMGMVANRNVGRVGS